MLFVPVLAGCRAPQPAVIGDAFAEPWEGEGFMQVVRRALDSTGTHVQLARWSSPDAPALHSAADQALRFATTPGILGVVGHAGSRDAILGAKVYNSAHIPQIVPNATSRQLADVGPWTFTLVGDDADEGAFLATYALDSLHATRIAVIHVADEYGNGLRDGVAAALRDRGALIVDEIVLPNALCGVGPDRDVQRLPVLASLERGNPDAVILALGSSGACIVDILLRERPTLAVLGADGVVGTDSVLAALPDDVRARYRGVEFALPTSDSTWMAFRARVQTMLHRDPTPSEALRYDAYLLLASAIGEAGPNRDRIREWLASLGHGRPAWPGVTGPVSFTNGRRRMPLRMVTPGSGA